MKKLACLLLVIVMVFSLMTGCSSDSVNNQDIKKEGSINIKVSEIRSLNWASVYIAHENGFFEEEGLNIEFTQPGGPKGFQAMHAGDSQFSMLSQEPAIVAQEQGMETTILGTMVNKEISAFVSKGDITDLSQLKGKKIYGSVPGSGPYAFVSSLLMKAGLDPLKDVTFINMEYGASLVALEKGEIDAGFIDSYSVLELEKMDMKTNVLVDTLKTEDSLKFLDSEDIPATMICATTEYVKNNPEITQKFVTAVVKGTKWIKDHSDEEVAKALLPSFSGMEEEEIAKRIALIRDAISDDCFITKQGFDSVIKKSLNTKLISKEVSYEDMVNMSFVQQANK